MGLPHVRLARTLIALAVVFGLTALGTHTPAVYPSSPSLSSSLSSPLAPQPLEIVGHLGAAPHDVVLRDGYAYLATGYAFEVWDLGDPARPVRVSQLVRRGFLPEPDSGDSNSPTRLSLDGPRAYLLDRNMVRMLDITDPTSPREVGNFRFWTDITHMAVRGSTLYLTAHPAGIGVAVVDITDPASPKLVRYTADGIYTRLALVGNTLLAIGDQLKTGSGPDGVRVFDLSAPQAPQSLGQTTLMIDINSYELVASAHYLYAAGNDGLHVYDVSDPNAIRQVALYRTTKPVDAIDLANGRAYITYRGQIEVLDLADPTQPRSLGSLSIGPWTGSYADASIAVAAGVVMVTGRDGIVRTIDASDDTHLRELARLDAELPRCDRIAVGARHVYVANRQWPARVSGLTVVDVSTPATPVIVGGYTFPNDRLDRSILDLAVQGTRLYVLTGIYDDVSELYVLDVTNPASPRREAVADLGKTVGDGLIVRGNLAYVATYINGESRRLLQVVDLGAPGGPRLIGTVEVAPAGPNGEGLPALALLGHYVLLGLSIGTAVIDVQDPARPALLSRLKDAISLDGGPVAASQANGYQVYRTNADAKIHIGTIDISDATAPQLAGDSVPNWAPLNLGMSADHLFAGSPEGVQMFNFSHPDQLRRTASVSLPSEVRGIVLRNGYAYVADGDAGLFILYTGDADPPEVVPPTRTPAPAPTATRLPGPAEPEAHVCPQILRRVPRVVLDAGLANPKRIEGWNQLQNPSVPAGPLNLRRVWLTIRNISVPYDAVFNPVLYRASCP